MFGKIVVPPRTSTLLERTDGPPSRIATILEEPPFVSMILDGPFLTSASLVGFPPPRTSTTLENIVAGGPTFTSTFDVIFLLLGEFPDEEIAPLFSDKFSVILLGFISSDDCAAGEDCFVGFVSMTEEVVAAVFLPPSAQKDRVGYFICPFIHYLTSLSVAESRMRWVMQGTASNVMLHANNTKYSFSRKADVPQHLSRIH